MRFFMISDLHLVKPEGKDFTEAEGGSQNLYFENIKTLCAKIRDEITVLDEILFIVLGDIVNNGKKEGYEYAEKCLDFLKMELKDYDIKFEFIPGNHDLIENKLEYFDSFIHKFDANYSFMDSPVVSKIYDGINFIFADSTLSRDYSAPGRINLNEIQSYIKKGKQNILFCHHALTHHSKDKHNCVENGDTVSEELRTMGIDFCFHSHTHSCDVTFSANRVTEIGCGSISKDVSDMPGINNQFSVGGTFDGKIVTIDRWIKTNDGKSGVAYERLYPEGRKFTDPENVEKIKYTFDINTYIDRRILPINNNTYSAQPITLKDALIKTRRIFLLGDAGDGKTIELQKLACDLYISKPNFFPVFYFLKSYTGQEICKIIPEQYLELKPERLVLILDGYDEIQDKYRQNFEGKLNDYLDKNPYVRVIISTRKNFYKASSDGNSQTLRGFSGYEFERITGDSVKKYLSKRGIDPSKFAEAADSAKVIEMIYNPFYLNGLASIFLKKNTLPSKGSVMQEMIEQCLENDDGKFSNNDISENKYVYTRYLEDIALAMQLMLKTELTEQEYQEIIPSEQRKQVKSNGLFTYSKGIRRFTHNNFREYLAAKRLARMPMERVLKYCCIGNEIKPHWTNTFGYIIGLSDDVELKKWITENACETFVKYSPDNFDSIDRFEIFKRVFEKYERNYMRSNEGLCSESELAEYACCIRGINYLIDKVNSPAHGISLHNALRILQHLPRTCGGKKAIKTCLLTFCEGYPQNRPSDCRCAIHAIARLDLNDADVAQHLMELFQDCYNDYIRTGMYEYLTYTKEQDKYVQYFLNGIPYIGDYSGRRIGNEQRALLEGLEAMSSAESISSILEWFYKTNNYHFYNNNKVFCSLCSKASKLYRYGDHQLFDIMYNCWLWVAKKALYKELSAISDFFAETGSCEEAVLKLITNENSNTYYFGLLFNSDTQIIDALEQLYIQNKIPDKINFVKFIERHLNPTAYNRLIKTVNKTENKALPEFSPQIDYNKERKEGALKYLICLFDKNKYEELIDQLLSKIGDKYTTAEELEERLLPDFEHYCPLFKVRSAIINRLPSDYQVKDFLDSIEWEKFSIDEIYKITTNESLMLNDEQKNTVIEMIRSECENGIFNGAVSKDGYVSSHLRIILHFSVLLDILLPKTELPELTAIPWFGFSDDDHKIKYLYLESKFSKKSLIDQVAKDVKKDLVAIKTSEPPVDLNTLELPVDLNTLEHHIDFLCECKCESIVDEALEICTQNIERSGLSQSAVKYLHDLFGHDYIEQEVLPVCNRDMVMCIAQTFKDIDRNILKLAMEREYLKNKDDDLQAYLITYNSETALKDYLKIAQKTNAVPKNTGHITDGTTVAISGVSDIGLLPLLDELTRIAFNPGFRDAEFESLHNSLYKAYTNCAKTSIDRVLKSIDSFISGFENEQIFFNRLKTDILQEELDRQDDPMNPEDVKKILYP